MPYFCSESWILFSGRGGGAAGIGVALWRVSTVKGSVAMVPSLYHAPVQSTITTIHDPKSNR